MSARPRSPLRWARHVSLAEIGTLGQAKLEAASVREGSGDVRALAVAMTYLERAGVRCGDGEPLEVRSAAEIERIAGRPELSEAAAFLVGALAATERIATVVGAPARPAVELPVLVDDRT
jgi:hypothetical protein